MFTGIIEHLAKLVGKTNRGGQRRLSFELSKPLSFQLGESIAVNGVCLTVSKKSRKGFEADVIEETLRDTNLGQLAVGTIVHLEKSLRYGERIGGHFVTGHVNAKGILTAIQRNQRNISWILKTDSHAMRWIVPKGSIAVDGVSLTVQKTQGSFFMIGLVPHSLKHTTFRFKKEGDRLNLETDLLAHYSQKKKTEKKNKTLRLRELERQGF